ncbi:multidrug efflux SMR transporter [uncultured Endozoicomonas sp.]|uniref:SMR family transporter n=1 Tax=uncultured Endozoicomonas sp. TaxID=432652 RepID=UPI0026089D28|nr:multidrug efflux SMR transporter [uncultured Endozoicomonas sp.]
MSDHLQLIAIFWIVAASSCDIFGNVLTKLSNGFTKKRLAVLVMIVQIAAFVFLSFALKSIDLSVAYALWGSLGIIATSIIGRVMFGESLHPVKVLGICITLVAIVFLKLSM